MSVTESFQANRGDIIALFERTAASLGKNRLANSIDGVAAALWLRLSVDETEDFIGRLEQAMDFKKYPKLRPLPDLARGVLYSQSL